MQQQVIPDVCHGAPFQGASQPSQVNTTSRIANENMKKLLRQCGDEQLNLPSVKGFALRELLFPSFGSVRDCVILSDKQRS